MFSSLICMILLGLLALTLPFAWLLFCLSRAAVRPVQQSSKATANPRSNILILVPAHNEEISIAKTVESLLRLDYPRELFAILVIADNCQDQTMARAAAAGAKVIERNDPHKRSKGFALEFAIQHLENHALKPDAVVVVDADTKVDQNLLRAFDQRLSNGQDWLQAYYTVANADESWRTQMMTLAFSLFNGVWLLGLDKLGLGSALRGNGMAFSWAGLARVPLQAYGLAEDLEFSWRLRLAGEKVHFVPEARVFGDMIDGHAAAITTQRLRWEHGRRQVRQTFRGLIWRASAARSQKFLWLLDLYMPSLAAYAARLTMGLAFSCLVLWLSRVPAAWTIAWLALLLLGLQFFGLVFYLGLGFCQMRLPLRYLRTLAFSPIYMLWKLRLRATQAPRNWVRTERHDPGAVTLPSATHS